MSAIDDQLADLLDQYSKDHAGAEVDPERLSAALADGWAWATSDDCPVADLVAELQQLGGQLSMPPAIDGECEVRFGLPDRKTVVLFSFPLDQITTRPSG